MTLENYLEQLDTELFNLVAFARQINELDLAACIGQESRGMQDAGWATTITAYEVFDEMLAFNNLKRPMTRAELRILLMLYAQLSEAGGVYEGLKNLIGVVKLKPYVMWPFQNLVRVRQAPRRIIGPNANATFRDLATAAREIGMLKLSELLENAFRDDLRNGISHADYIIWNDEVRLRKRNGGHASSLSFDQVFEAINRGIGFFDTFKDQNSKIAKSFSPGRDIIGRLSMNPPMRWHVKYDTNVGSFSISGSSPGVETSPEFNRQSGINNKLGGKVIALYTSLLNEKFQTISDHIASHGLEPHTIVLPPDNFDELVQEIEQQGLWDSRFDGNESSSTLLATPWGFIRLRDRAEFDAILPKQTQENG